MTRYSLELGMAALANPEQMPVYDELYARDDKEIIPGGSALNSARASKHAGASTAYFGCVGDDAKGQALEQACQQVGIECQFEKTSEEPTGTCGVVVVGKERTLIANIAAAKKFTLAYLEANMSVLQRAKFLYTTGFFVDSNFEAVKAICAFATANDRPLGFNLSALFVIQFYMDQVRETIKHAEYVFCNEDEGSAFATANGLEATDREGIAKQIACYEKASTTRPRVVIITQGA